MNDALSALLWVGGPALVFGVFAVVLHSISAGPRWLTQWQHRRTTTAATRDTPEER